MSDYKPSKSDSKGKSELSHVTEMEFVSGDSLGKATSSICVFIDMNISVYSLFKVTKVVDTFFKFDI